MDGHSIQTTKDSLVTQIIPIAYSEQMNKGQWYKIFQQENDWHFSTCHPGWLIIFSKLCMLTGKKISVSQNGHDLMNCKSLSATKEEPTALYQVNCKVIETQTYLLYPKTLLRTETLHEVKWGEVNTTSPQLHFFLESVEPKDAPPEDFLVPWQFSVLVAKWGILAKDPPLESSTGCFCTSDFATSHTVWRLRQERNDCCWVWARDQLIQQQRQASLGGTVSWNCEERETVKLRLHNTVEKQNWSNVLKYKLYFQLI